MGGQMLKLDSNLCCGCTACVSICPQNCLEMVADAEGFLEPKLNDNKCIDCGLCNKICPVLNPVEEKIVEQHGFIVQHLDAQVRRESTSGGAFSAIAESIINDGGIVYGAVYGEDFTVKHVGITDKSEIWRFRNSKYVQSFLGDTFRDIRSYLINGVKVCFSGTPCQIEGLRAFLQKDYSNLLLVDVVCHGIGSPLIWRKYLELFKDKMPEQIFFRWKHYGYKYSTMSFFANKEEFYYGGVESDPMLRAYFSNNCDRLTCYDCPFKKRYRIADITIWDCFQPRYFDRSFDDDCGTTAVLIHSGKGMKEFSSILANKQLKYMVVDTNELVLGNNEMINSVKCGSVRSAFLADAAILPGRELFMRYFPNTPVSRIKKNVRILLLRLGIYNKVKYLLFLKRRVQPKQR